MIEPLRRSAAGELTIDILNWKEKLQLINNDGPYHHHSDLVEKLKAFGVLEYCEVGELFDFSVEGAEFRNKVYQYVDQSLE